MFDVRSISLKPKANIEIPKGITPIKNLDEFNSDTSLKNYNKGKVVIKFFMPNCGHCIKLAPDYERAANDPSVKDDVQFLEVDITSKEGEKIADMINSQPKPKFLIRGVPKIVAYLDGKFVGVYAPGDQSAYRSSSDIALFGKNIGIIPVEKDDFAGR
jgi:thiol-disulfide isomerase/thioredoxin